MSQFNKKKGVGGGAGTLRLDAVFGGVGGEVAADLKQVVHEEGDEVDEPLDDALDRGREIWNHVKLDNAEFKL